MSLDVFIDTLMAEKGYSVHTCRAYRSDIYDFIQFVLDKQDTDEINGEKLFWQQLNTLDKTSIRNYLAQLVRFGKTKRTIARKLSSLKAFFDYLVK